MSEYILKTRGLTKVYSGKAANDGIDMNIKKGDIYGFIGRNGAGKTTLIKLVTGLAIPTKGSMELFSGNSAAELSVMRRRLGCMTELPALYPYMTAWENLEYRRRLLGIPDRKAPDEILETVRLSDTGRKKVKKFSLGMKQRLGIALALLRHPDFLILDEPVNGLDPIGMIEIRELLSRLNREKGITILISSHILGELPKLVTCYGIIDNGRLIEEFSAGELGERCKKYLRIRVSDVEKACFVLEANVGSKNYNVQPDKSIRLYEMFDKAGTITSELAKNDIEIGEITTEGQDLESYFMKMTGGVMNV